LSSNRGFSLIEALITAVVVAGGLAVVAAMFSYSIRANAVNRQMSVATALLYDKMEELKWSSVAGDGSEEVTLDDTYVRVWHINTSVPRTVTVIVYARTGALTRRQTELIRATTLTTPIF
jgi:Tfp pilus assembly protein PilV